VSSLTEETVRAAVHRALADVNATLPEDRKIPVTGDANVLALLDSLGTLNLVLRIERRLTDATGADWDLTGSDIYERTLFHSPTLDELIGGVHAALQASR
jgi:hypothetical protein